MAEVPKSVLDARTHEAYVQDGYVDEDGAKDNVKLRARMLEIVKIAKVLKRTERPDKAVTKGDLVAQTFPSLLGPEMWEGIEDEDERAVAEAVYAKVASGVWGETLPDATKPLQQAVEAAMGNGYVLCRTTIGNDKTPAVYITDDFACIQLDVTRPENVKFDRFLTKVERNREMLVRRQPGNAERYFKEFRTTSTQALNARIEQLRLAKEAGAWDAADSDGETDGDE